MSRLRLTVETALALLAVACFGCLAFLWRAKMLSIGSAGIALIVPAVATVLYLCVTFAVPEIFAVGRIRFPLNLTLPTIYTALIVLTVVLVSRVGPSITRPSDRFEIINIWARLPLLLVTFLGAVAALSILTVSSKEESKAPS